MKIILGLILFLGQTAFCQYQLRIRLIHQNTHEPVAGASCVIKGTDKSAASDSNGILLIQPISKGKYTCTITSIGYERKEVPISVPVPGDSQVITLEPEEEVLQDVTVSSTRVNGKIKDLPVRVEVLGTEDMEEETYMHPSNIAMLLSEASGIQTQQTSVSSGNVQIRILGLDGKYTQLLKDGFPMYSGFSNGLSVMQIPPLDLRQVELIKGSSSSLYGGDAIAGIINFISQTPTSRPHWNILANQTSRQGTDLGSYFTGRNKHWGFTMLNTLTHQNPIDIHNDGFTVMPKLTAFTINPKLFWYPSDKSTFSLALNSTYDNRTGGDLEAVKNGPTPEHPYTEQNKSNRNFYQMQYELKRDGGDVLTFRNSLSLFNRDILIPEYTFSGKELSSFSEISYLYNWHNHKTVGGLNLITDKFRENRQTDSLLRDYNLVTTGLFVQDDWELSRHFTLETGIRNDYQNRFGNFFLPRLSLLWKIENGWSMRAGGGLGYKSATIFDAQTEQTAYRNVLPIASSVNAERSAGVNLNLNYTGKIFEDVRLILDQSFFYTQIHNPLVLDTIKGNSGGASYYYFVNALQPYTTRGFETSVRLREDNWSMFAGYTYLDARTGDPVHPYIPLTPRNKVVFDLSYEKENDYRIALEAFYTGKQYLSDGTPTKDYWVTGLLVQKTFNWLTLVMNFENLTDTRQTKFGPVVIPPYTNPTFSDIYAPLEGFMANLAVKIRIL
jgi:iron complex outermembrane receptor protein